MKTGDLYVNRYGKISIHIEGKSHAFGTDNFNTKENHASLEKSGNICNLMYNCTVGKDETLLNLNILDLLNDPEIIKVLKEKCQII